MILPKAIPCLSQSRLNPVKTICEKIYRIILHRLFPGIHQYLCFSCISGKVIYGSHPASRYPDSVHRNQTGLPEHRNLRSSGTSESDQTCVGRAGTSDIHERTARYIRRGYDLPVFETAVSELRRRGIDVIVHTILCLPGETKPDMLQTIQYLNRQDIQGIKLQLLHILKDTDLAEIYASDPFPVPDPQEYYELLGACINHLRPDIVIHRLTGDGPKELLTAPLWTCNKRQVLNQLQSYFKTHDIWQGKEY